MSAPAATQTQVAVKPAVTPIQGGLLQRQCACGQHTPGGSGECEDCKQKRHGTLQRTAFNPTPLHEVPPSVHEVLRSPGQPFDAGVRAFMEPRFGYDFSGVSLQSNARAAESTRAERTNYHLTQNWMSPKIQAKLTVNKPGDAYEENADRIAEHVYNSEINQKRPSAHHEHVHSSKPGVLRIMPFVYSTLEQTGTIVPDHVQQRLTQPQTGGHVLPLETRQKLDTHIGCDLSNVRVHTGSDAHEMTGELAAKAFTVGSHIYFGQGQYRPESPDGLRLIAHEVTHTIQQGVEQRSNIQAKKKDKPEKIVTKITLFVNRDYVVIELDGKSTITLPTVYNGKPEPGTYKISGKASTPPVSGVANDKGWVVEWTFPTDANYKNATKRTFFVIAGRPGPSEIAGDDSDGSSQKSNDNGTEDQGNGVPKNDKGADDKGTGGKGTGDKSTGDKGPGDKGGAKGDSSTSSSDTAPRLTPEEEAIWRQLAEMMKGANQQSPEDPVELIRLFQVLRSVVVNPQFSKDSGESWVDFARFLDKNRDKIEGYLRSSPNGQLTEKILEKIINDYGKYLAVEPDSKHPDSLETDKDFDKEFKYDPGWQKLSSADRKLLLEYSRMSPDEISDKKIDFTRITTDMKVGMALKLADTSLLGEMAEAAKNAFTDPKFLITLIVTMAIYVGLWLTPDPSAFTKLLAAALTVWLLAQFAIEDIYGFAVAWSDLIDDCARATTVAELKAVGEKFLKRIGPIGFDIMLFIVMWRIGKLAGPKLSKIGAERGVARAEVKVKGIEAKPGSGIPENIGAKAGDLLSTAKNTAEGTTATQVLNAMNKLLPEDARQGLEKMRAKAGDAHTLKSMEGQASRGNNLAKYLVEQNLPPEAGQAVKAELAKARLDLARAKLIQAETIKDSALRETVRDEQYRAIRTILQETGALEMDGIKQALAARDLKGLIRALRNIMSQLGDKVSAHETQGAIGEAIQRAQLRIKYAGRKGVQFLSNLALVRKIGNFKSLREWITAEETRIKQRQSNITEEALNKEVSKTRVKLLEKDNQVYETIGEVDTMVVEPVESGSLRPLEVAEVKAGDKPASEAMSQLDRIIDGFDRISQGDQDIKVFEMTGKKSLGKDLTPKLDLSLSKTIEQSTRGPEGKSGFTQSLGFTDAELKGVAESLLKNLPPSKPTNVAPVTSPREDEKNPEPVH